MVPSMVTSQVWRRNIRTRLRTIWSNDSILLLECASRRRAAAAAQTLGKPKPHGQRRAMWQCRRHLLILTRLEDLARRTAAT